MHRQDKYRLLFEGFAAQLGAKVEFIWHYDFTPPTTTRRSFFEASCGCKGEAWPTTSSLGINIEYCSKEHAQLARKILPTSAYIVRRK